MRKRILTIVGIVLALILALGVFAACNKDKDNKYSVTFKDGSTVVKTVSVNRGDELVAKDIPAAPKHEREVFDGWYVGADVVSTGYVPSGSITALAKYHTPVAGEYIVKFSLGEYDGNNSAPSDMAATSGTLVELPNIDFDFQGLLFGGWHIEGQTSTLYGAGDVYQVFGNVNFVAVWVVNEAAADVALSFVPNNGGETTSVKAKPGETINAPQAPQKAGLTFVGWYTNAELTGEAVQFPARMPKDGGTYYAKWATRYIVRRQLQNVAGDGYTPDDVIYDIPEGDPITEVDVTAAITGFIFVDGETVFTPVNGGVYELKYDRQHYTVTYKLNLEDYEVENERVDSVVYGQRYKVAEQLYGGAEGYMFKGWSEAEEGRVVKEYVTITGPMILYAQWLEAYLDANGGYDYIYYDADAPTKIYLERLGMDDYVVGKFDVATQKFMFNMSDFQLTGTLNQEIGSYCYDVGDKTYYWYNDATESIEEDSYVVLHDDGTAKVKVEDGVFSRYKAGNDGLEIQTLPAGEYDNVTYIYDSGNFDYVLTITADNGTVYEFGFANGWANKLRDDSPDMAHFDVFFTRGLEAGYYCVGIDEEGYLDTSLIVILTGYGTAIVVRGDRQYVCEYEVYKTSLGLGVEAVLDLSSAGANKVLRILSSDYIGTTTSGYILRGLSEYNGMGEDGVYTNGNESLFLTGYSLALENVAASELYDDYCNAILSVNGKNENMKYVVSDYFDSEYYGDDFVGLENTQYSLYILNLYNAVDGEWQPYNRQAYALAKLVGKEWQLSFGWMPDALTQANDSYFYADLTEGSLDLGYIIMKADSASQNGGAMMYVDKNGNVKVGTYAKGAADGQYTFTADGTSFDFRLQAYDDDSTFQMFFAYSPDNHVINGEFKHDNEMLSINFIWASYVDAYGIQHNGTYYDVTKGDSPTYKFVCADENCDIAFTFTVEDGKFILSDKAAVDAKDYFYLDLEEQSIYTGLKLTVDATLNATVSNCDDPSVESPVFKDVVKGNLKVFDLINGVYTFGDVQVLDDALATEFGLKDSFNVKFLTVTATGGVKMNAFMTADDLAGTYTVKDLKGQPAKITSLGLNGFGDGTMEMADEGLLMIANYAISAYRDGHYIVTLAVGSTSYSFELNTSDNTAVLLDSEGFMMYNLTDGMYIYNVYMLLDGKGNVDIIYYDSKIDETKTVSESTSTYDMEDASYGSVTLDYVVFKEGTDMSYEQKAHWNDNVDYLRDEFGMTEDFQFVLVTLGDYMCFLVYNEALEDIFVCDDGSVLVTDGYFQAEYIDKYGNYYSSGQFVIEEREYYNVYLEPTTIDLLRFSSYDDFTFVLSDDGTFHRVGNEIGAYDYFGSATVYFDGEGGFLFNSDTLGIMFGTYVLEDDIYSSATGYIYQEVTVTVPEDYDDDGNPTGYVDFRFQLDQNSYSCYLYDESIAGEFTNAVSNNTVVSMYGNGYMEFLIVLEDGTRVAVVLYSIEEEENGEECYKCIMVDLENLVKYTFSLDLVNKTYAYSGMESLT